MQENLKSNGGFLGGRFKTCPSCGELIGFEETECRFCGAKFQGTSSAESPPPPDHRTFSAGPDQPTAFQSTQPMSAGLPDNLQPCYTPSGESIPPEYGAGFNPCKFCWPAFFFAEYWYTEKGLVQRGMKHFWVRIITTLMFVLAMVALMDAGTSGNGGDPVSIGKGLMAGSLFLIWFAGVFASGAIAYIDALSAYRNYLDSYNRMFAAGTCEAVRANGIRLYWKILLTPFFIFLIFFIVIISSIKND